MFKSFSIDSPERPRTAEPVAPPPIIGPGVEPVVMLMEYADGPDHSTGTTGRTIQLRIRYATRHRDGRAAACQHVTEAVTESLGRLPQRDTLDTLRPQVEVARNAVMATRSQAGSSARRYALLQSTPGPDHLRALADAKKIMDADVAAFEQAKADLATLAAYVTDARAKGSAAVDRTGVEIAHETVHAWLQRKRQLEGQIIEKARAAVADLVAEIAAGDEMCDQLCGNNYDAVKAEAHMTALGPLIPCGCD